MNCPHTWFSTELRGGRRLLRARLRDLLRPALVERYTDMDPEGALTFFYLGDYLSQDFPSVWGFRAVQRRGSGWVVLDDWYQDQAEGQVFNRNFNLEGLFSYVPGTFRFPVSFPNPAGRFYPELDQYARALSGGGDYRYSHMTLTAAHYFDPEDPYPTLPEGRELLTLGRWTDPRIPAGNGWYYLPVSDFTWYPRSQFWADYQEVLTWPTSRAVFTLYWQNRKYAAPAWTFGPGGDGVFVSGAFIPRCRPPGSSPRRSPGRRAGPGRGRRTGR